MIDILLTNDDGYEAAGLAAAASTLEALGLNVWVVAPASEKSACAHSLTLTRPLRLIELAPRRYKLDDGTPSDCVYLGLFDIFRHKKPDLIISGINHGANVGEDITYSGTCAAAMEGVLQGVPSIAFSQLYSGDSLARLGFSLASSVMSEIVTRVLTNGFPLPPRQLLNVNIPPVGISEFKGIKSTFAGHRIYATHASKSVNPRGVEYFWLGEASLEYEPRKGSDIDALADGYASVTPIMLDMTAHDSLRRLGEWL